MNLKNLWPLPHNDSDGNNFDIDVLYLCQSFSGGGSGTGGDGGGGGDGGSSNTTTDDVLYIHHSMGSSWLTSGLSDALLAKEYTDERNDIRELTDVTPGTGRPDSLAPTPGNFTDMRHWILWFNDYLRAIRERDTADGINRIVMFNSDAFSNLIEAVGTAPGSPFAESPLTFENYKAVFQHPDGAGSGGIYTNSDGDVYKPLETIFEENSDMLFVVVTPPPLPVGQINDSEADLARQFATWLRDTWQPAYETRNPSLNNVVVFDLFDFLAEPSSAGTGLRHRLKEEYTRSGSTIPNTDGLRAATEYFVAGTDSVNSILDIAVDEFPNIDFSLPTTKVLTASAGQVSTKALELDAPQPGDDLFVTVKVSENASANEQFRVVIPASLPSRVAGKKDAGIRFVPTGAVSAGALTKTSPEEWAVQDFFGHDMVTMNTPLIIQDLISQSTTIDISGAAVAVLGLDASTNQKDSVRVNGTNGQGTEKTFTVAGSTWAVDAYKGDWLIDNRFEAYEITGNTATALTLLSGTPRDGVFKIVQNPTFLEQVVVEFYNELNTADFDIVTDLLPLNLDQGLSGVALYRDNDSHPDNRNGHFDVNIDIPLQLDGPPQLVGTSGDAPQVKFVFSLPGTSFEGDDPATQKRHRQWVPESWKGQNEGPEFFVVVRASDEMQVDDNFRVGIVSWGPSTPTEPDPNTFFNIDGPAREDYKKFQEFPWGNRGVGFITFYKDAPVRYFMDGSTPKAKTDNSGFNWVRTHSAQKKRSGVLNGRRVPVGPTSVVINSASTTTLPAQTLDENPFSFVIFGSGFGTTPEVVLTGYDVTVNEATNTSISVTIRTQADNSPQPPIVLIVRNPKTGKEASRSNLFTLANSTGDVAPKITRISPARAEKSDFPVALIGENLPTPEEAEVKFGSTLLKVYEEDADKGLGTRLMIKFPEGGFAEVGKLDVTVRNTSNGTEGMKIDGFDFVSEADGPGNLINCSGGGSSGGVPLGDLALLIMVLAGLMLGMRHKKAGASL